MNRFHLVLILVLGGCSLLSKPLMAADAASPFVLSKQFSADQVVTSGGVTMTDKIFSDGGKTRSEVNTGGIQMVSIIRPDLQKMYSIMVAQKMVMEVAYDPSKSSPVLGSEGKFELIGPDAVDGVACLKYKITSKDNKVSFMWIDAAKKTPVKTAAEDNSYTILWKNYKAGPQDAALFEPPADYQVMKIPAAAATPAPAPATPGGATGGSGQ